MAQARWYHQLPMSWIEDVACPCCGEVKIKTKVLAALRKVGHRYGQMIYITSAYRCPSHNASLPGSSPTSKHMAGLALDIAPLAQETREAFVETLDKLETACVETREIVFIKRYRTHVHIDLRPGQRIWKREV